MSHDLLVAELEPAVGILREGQTASSTAAVRAAGSCRSSFREPPANGVVLWVRIGDRLL